MWKLYLSQHGCCHPTVSLERRCLQANTCDFEGVDYVLVGPLLEWRDDGRYAYPAEYEMVARHAQEGTKGLTLIYENSLDKTRVYEVQP